MGERTTTLGADIRHTIADAWRHWRERVASSRELDSCDRAVVEGIAREFGLSVAELRGLAELGPGSTDLLYHRLAALGIDPATIEHVPLLKADLERCCARCGNKAECAHELDVDAQGEHWKSYCPNALTLSSLPTKRS